MDCNTPINKYSVIQIKVNNESTACDEIQKKLDKPMNFIVLHLEKGVDPMSDCKGSKYGEYQLSGSNYSSTIDGVSHQCYVSDAVIACLKDTSKFKYKIFSLFTALTQIFTVNGWHFGTDDNDYPYIIINTGLDYRTAEYYDISDMVNEVTASYMNHFMNYPTIFVTYKDDGRLITDIDPEKIGKHKKKKKNKKTKKGNK